MDFNDRSDVQMLNISSKYLMKYNYGKFNAKDAIFMTEYLTRTAAKQFGIGNNISVNILSQKDFESKYGAGVLANCQNNENTKFTMNYSAEVVMEFLKQNDKSFISGMQTIAHELTHAYQNMLIASEGTKEPYSRAQYIMALEEAVKATDDEFYEKNYMSLYKEGQAEYQGIVFAENMLQQLGRKDLIKQNEEYIQQKKHYVKRWSTKIKGLRMIWNGIQLNIQRY